MSQSSSHVFVRTFLRVAADVQRFGSSVWRSRAQLAAENLFLRKQLAPYLERQVKPRRADDATRIALVALSRLIDWRQLLTVGKPETLIRWHRKGLRLCSRRKSMARGRPRVPADVRRLIADMAAANRTWGEERIASELLVKLGIRISPRTVRRYMPASLSPGSKSGPGSQAWSSFVRNHARAVLACDFFVAVTATFRVLYIFVMEAGTRRIVHWNVIAHATAEWTATVLKTPVRAPQANAFCERLIGHDRTRVSGFPDPLNERHVRRVFAESVGHYNRGRPHSSLGPGILDGPAMKPVLSGHRIREGHDIVAAPILGGLHHEYCLEPQAA
jgi:transposase InsO family protein